MFTEKTLFHEGNAVRAFYAALEGPVVVGIEATGAMQWFLELLEELGIECRVVSVSTMAMVCCLACRSQPTIFISASFRPEPFWLDTAKSTRVRGEADVVMTSATLDWASL